MLGCCDAAQLPGTQIGDEWLGMINCDLAGEGNSFFIISFYLLYFSLYYSLFLFEYYCYVYLCVTVVVDRDTAWDRLVNMNDFGAGNSKANSLYWTATRATPVPRFNASATYSARNNMLTRGPSACAANSACDALGERILLVYSIYILYESYMYCFIATTTL